MSIHTLLEKIKGWAGERRPTLIYIGILTLVAVFSFYLGYIARMETRPIPLVAQKPLQDRPSVLKETQVAKVGDNTSLSTSAAPKDTTSGSFVASKNGTKYYPVACSSAKRIKDANKVFFQTADEAHAEGYTLASGC
jgi:hypothetical protein